MNTFLNKTYRPSTEALSKLKSLSLETMSENRDRNKLVDEPSFYDDFYLTTIDPALKQFWERECVYEEYFSKTALQNEDPNKSIKRYYFSRLFDLYHQDEQWFYKGNVYKFTLATDTGKANIEQRGDVQRNLFIQHLRIKELEAKLSRYGVISIISTMTALIALNLSPYLIPFGLALIAGLVFVEYRQNTWKRKVKRIYKEVSKDNPVLIGNGIL